MHSTCNCLESFKTRNFGFNPLTGYYKLNQTASYTPVFSIEILCSFFFVNFIRRMERKAIKSVAFPCYLIVFHVSFIILMAVFAQYDFLPGREQVPGLYASNITLKFHLSF